MVFAAASRKSSGKVPEGDETHDLNDPRIGFAMALCLTVASAALAQDANDAPLKMKGATGSPGNPAALN